MAENMTAEQFAVTPKKWNGAMSLVDEVITEVAKKRLEEVGIEELKDELSQKVLDYIIATYGTVQKKVDLHIGERTVHIEGAVHNKFEEILQWVSAGEPVFLIGPAGSGKNVICEQVAKALGIDFYFTNCVTQEYKLTGFTNAMGKFMESQFYKAFTKGGLFFLDELDGSIPDAVLILNSAIANGYFDFPAPIGRVYAHPDFHVIAAGNTFGHGATFKYAGRNQLDGATLNRFAKIIVDYDEGIEMAVANGNTELIQFAHSFRKACDTIGLNVIISYRDIGRIAKMENIVGLEKAMMGGVMASIEKGDMDQILGIIENKSNKYTKCFIQIAEGME